MPIPPRISAVALRTTDLARSTAFYVALGWKLSLASTAAMSLFKTAGSLLLVCTDELLAELGGQEAAAAPAGQPTGEAVLSIHVATDAEVDAALQEAAGAGGVVIKRAAPPRWAVPMGSLPTPTDIYGRSSTTRSTSSGPTGGPRSHSRVSTRALKRPRGARGGDVEQQYKGATCAVVMSGAEVIEPLTPCMPSMRRGFTPPCSTSRDHTIAQVKGLSSIGRCDGAR